MQLGKLRRARNVLSSLVLAQVQSRAQAGGQRSIVVVGARRSGHHAIILWLANCLENDEVQWKHLLGGRHLVSQSGQTFHINDWNVARRWSGNSELFLFHRLIRNAKFLVINYEDQDPARLDSHSRFPRNPHLKILVTRSTLNLVASRLSISAVRPASGPCPVDEPFLEVLMSYREVPPDWVVINFDAWLRDEEGYRSRVANRFGLHAGAHPSIVSHFGGGSSFTGTDGIPSMSELTHRYTQISWPDHVVSMLLQDRFSSLLTNEERTFLTGIRS